MKKFKKIKIAFFSPSSYLYFVEEIDANYGGAELQMFMLANSLASNSGFEILFFVADKGQSQVTFYNNIKLIKSINLNKVENYWSRIYKAIKFLIILIKYKPDVVLTTTSNSIVGLIAIYKIIFRKKHIHRTAALAEVDLEWVKNNGLTGKIFKFGFLKADIIITQSKDHQQLILKNYSKKAEILRNAYFIRENNQKKENFVLWVGRYDILKQAELYLKAAILLPQIHFIQICPFDQNDRKEWNLLFEQSKKLSNLDFIQSVPYSKIQDYFNRSAIFINTSLSEGFPNTFLQAAAAKTPIISLNVNPDNFLTQYNCGIYCKNDFNFMLSQIDYLINNEADKKKKGENAFQYLKEQHNIEIIGNQLVDIINGLMK